MQTVYHGSDHILKTPIYLGGKKNNDYGNGFYTTEYEDRAKSWATLNGNPDKSIVNTYHLDLNNLSILDLNHYGILAWIAEVVANRGMGQEGADIVGKELVKRYRINPTDYDIIIGYRADDSYTQVIEAFLLNEINISDVERLFYKDSLGNQIFLKSEQAFQNIHWMDAYEVLPEDIYVKNDLIARREVNHFLSARRKAILLEDYKVPGITARFAIQNNLIYHCEGNYYENTSL